MVDTIIRTISTCFNFLIKNYFDLAYGEFYKHLAALLNLVINIDFLKFLFTYNEF